MHIPDLVFDDDKLLDSIAESVKLAKALRKFIEKMGKKLTIHLNDKGGWDDDVNARLMADGLIAALKDGDYVSVANYAMFLDALGYKPKSNG